MCIKYKLIVNSRTNHKKVCTSCLEILYHSYRIIHTLSVFYFLEFLKECFNHNQLIGGVERMFPVYTTNN